MSEPKHITKEQIEEALKDGRLPNKILWHHYNEIATCGQIIDEALDKCAELGFGPVSTYYAYLQQLYALRFGIEDSGAGKILQPIDEEVVKDQMEHRKKFTTERIKNPTEEDKKVIEKYTKGKIEP